MTIEDIRKWYGGYTLYESKYFNPWSVINFLANKGMYLVYWALEEFFALGNLSAEYDRGSIRIITNIPNAEVLQVF